MKTLHHGTITPKGLRLALDIGNPLCRDRIGDVTVPIIGYTQIHFFEILLNQTEIRLYLPFSD